jgi:hypothetical protein
MENKILSWKTKEFIHYEKGTGWYLTFAALAALFIGYEIYVGDYFAALTFFIIAVIAYIFSKLTPKEVQISITDKGIKIDNFEIPYLTIKRFWMVDHAKAKALHLETTAYLNRFIVIQLDDQDPAHVRSILVEFLEESDPNRETIAQRVGRKLRF